MLINQEKVLEIISVHIREYSNAFDNANELYQAAKKRKKDSECQDHLRALYELNAKMTALGRLHAVIEKLDTVDDTPPPKASDKEEEKTE